MSLKKLATIIGIMTIALSSFTYAAENAKAQGGVIVKYKKYERFDLGNLEIKGEIIAPGDLSVLERERQVFDLKLFDRKNFDEEMVQNIIFLR